MAKYCPYCVSKIEQGNICPYCDGALHYRPKEHHLKPGSLLNNKYLVGRVLGEGGFGITYVGRDLTLDMKVAIKEYYPNGMASRSNTSNSTISLVDWTFSNEFKKGREQFINEAQTIAKMDKESAVVTVRDFFEQNNSAYIVMEFVEGEDLRTIIKKQQKPMEPETLLNLLEPVFNALDELHGIGLIHRDISPDNIMIEDDRARLIDFGCARETMGGKQADAVLKHSFSPIEQYENRNLGPWTDVYAMASTIYYCITGKLAPKATDRVLQDELQPPSNYGIKLKPKQEKALMKALALAPQDRFQSMTEFGKDLFIHKNRGRRIAMIAVAAAVLAVVAFFVFKPEEKLDIQAAERSNYEIVTIADKLSKEEEKKLRQISEMVSDLTLRHTKEGYSEYYLLELNNNSDYDYDNLQTRIRYFNREGVNIDTSYGGSDSLKRGETKTIRFSSYGSEPIERAEIKAIVTDDERGLETEWLPINISEMEEAVGFELKLQNRLPETIAYVGRDGSEYEYTITDFSYSVKDYGSTCWVDFYLTGTYNHGPSDKGGYLSYQLLNEAGEEVKSGNISMSRMQEGAGFEDKNFYVSSVPKGNYVIVLSQYR